MNLASQDVTCLANDLKQEKLFIDSEKKCLKLLNEEVNGFASNRLVFYYSYHVNPEFI